MAIKVTLGEAKPQTDIYPKIMISIEGVKGIIVLMKSDRKGTVLNNTEDYELGYYSDEWIMRNFQDYKGSITLQNQ